MAQPVQDIQTVTPDGERVAPLVEGVTFREVTTHVDDRGTVCELYDERWDWHPDPLVFAYMFTIRPGKVKGWGMHRRHEDRYMLVQGEMEVVLYDEREDSSTHGLVSKVVVSHHRRRLMNIPIGVWHATQNIGDTDLLCVNFPTIPYGHEDPDKYRLPLDTDQIPYTFTDLQGW